MSEVAGIKDVRDLRMRITLLGANEAEYTEALKATERLEALLRNRQELVALIEVIHELNEADILDADKIDELYAKAKELVND